MVRTCGPQSATDENNDKDAALLSRSYSFRRVLSVGNITKYFEEALSQLIDGGFRIRQSGVV